MAGRRAAGAEVAGGRYQGLAEVVHPDAIDDHAAGHRVVGGGDGPGQVNPAAAMRERPPPVPARIRRNCRGTDSPGWAGFPRTKS